MLTARSRDPETPLADFLWFGPRWDVAANTFRLPYFHRNAATEFLACLYGSGLGRSDEFLPGGGSVEISHTPHGNFSEDYVLEMRNQVNEPRKILESKSACLSTEVRSRSLIAGVSRSNDHHGGEQPVLLVHGVCPEWMRDVQEPGHGSESLGCASRR